MRRDETDGEEERTEPYIDYQMSGGETTRCRTETRVLLTSLCTHTHARTHKTMARDSGRVTVSKNKKKPEQKKTKNNTIFDNHEYVEITGTRRGK